MNIRIHSFQVYYIETPLGTRYWTMNLLKHEDAKLLKQDTLWNVLYLAEHSDKGEDGKVLVKKHDLVWILRELSGTGGLDRLVAMNK